MSSCNDGPFALKCRLREAVPGFLLGIAFFLALPVQAAGIDSSAAADTLPPAGTYLAIHVADSATGESLAGADVNIRNAQALYTMASTNAAGWAFVARSGLPRTGPSASNPTYPPYWVTAGSPGYISRMITDSGCKASEPPCVFRYALPRATAKNSLTFTGTLIDSASGASIAGYAFDLSHDWLGGWMTHVSRTDDSGHFEFTGIPVTISVGYLWFRVPTSRELFRPVYMNQGGKSIPVADLTPTSLASPRLGLRPADPHGSAPFLLFRSRSRDAAGRRRD